MRKFYVELFKPAHFGAVDLLAVFLHILKVALRPLALPLFERDIRNGELLVAYDVGRIYYVESRVLYVHGKGYILCHDEGEPARLFVAVPAYRHAVADQRVGAVEILYHLNGGAVAAHAQPHKALKHVFSARGKMLCLYGSAFFRIGKIFHNARDIVGRYYFVAVQNNEIIVVLPAF